MKIDLNQFISEVRSFREECIAWGKKKSSRIHVLGKIMGVDISIGLHWNQKVIDHGPLPQIEAPEIQEES